MYNRSGMARTTVASARDGLTLPAPHTLIEEQVRRDPGAVAVEHQGETLTYGELWDWSATVAAELREAGAGTDVPVAVSGERTLATVPALLGVLRAGAAYLPLDLAFPRRRIEYMIADARVRLAVSHEAVAEPSVHTIDPWRLRTAPPAPALPGPPRLDDLAYVVYTSGSTGVPKGVAMPHRPLARLVHWQVERFARPQARTLQFTSLSFDVAYQEIFTTLACGGTIVSVDAATRSDFAALAEVVAEAGVERLFLPFVALDELARAFEAADTHPEQLVEVITAGEQLRITPAIERLFERSGATLDNQYGPSETHVATAELLTGDPRRWPRLPPIGRPVDGVEARVLGDDGLPVATGEAGMLHVGGSALARGYLHRPALTAERFVPDIAPGTSGARLYVTGDVVRQAADGRVEFLGRADDQVKIRGFRVELGEIEAVLAQSPAVVAAAAAAPPDDEGRRRLVAYVVLAWQGHVADVKRFLSTRLPAYMVPPRFVVVESLPLTPSGKIDRRALADLDDAATPPAVGAEPDPAPARSPERLRQLLATTGGLGPVSARDRLDELGLDSLGASRLAARISREWDMHVTPAEVFDAETVEQIEQLVAARATAQPAGAAGLAVERPPLADDGTVSYGQQRLWLFDRLTDGSTAHNVPALIELHGIDATRIRAALDRLVERHEALRTTFETVAGEPVQVVHEPRPLPVDEIDLRAVPLPERRERLRKLLAEERDVPFRLDEWPLLRCSLVHLGAGEAALLLVMHHIVTDGWSLSVIADDLRALLAGEFPQPLPLQYHDFTAWQDVLLAGPEGAELTAYWREQLAGVPTTLELPADRPRPPVPSFRSGEVAFDPGEELDRAVADCARRHRVSPFMVYLAGLAAVVHRYTDEQTFCIGTAASGRTRPELEPLVGFLVNTLPLRMDMSDEPSFAELLQRVRRTTLDALERQELPFEVILEELGVQRDASRMPLVQVFFAYDGTPPEPAGTVRLATPPLPQAGGAFELTLALWNDGRRHTGTIHYSADLFTAATARRLGAHLIAFLRTAVADAGRRCTDVAVVTGEERAAILAHAQGPPIGFDRAGFAHELVRGRARTAPDAIAVDFEHELVSYRELDERSERLARHLRRLGIGADSIVGVCANRSVELVLAVLAIGKAGGAYMALDPTYPLERIAHMLRDAAPVAVLAQRELLESLPPVAAPVVLLDADSPAWAEPPKPVVTEQAPRSLAYVVYTSGSTGEPKGVLLEHEGLINLVHEKLRLLRIEPGHRILQFSSPSFDSFVSEVYQALASGATLVLVPAESLVPGPDLTRLLYERHVTHATLPPSVLAAIDPDELPGLGTVLSAGEACTPQLVARWSSGRRFLNGYGPSETTVGATFAELSPEAGAPPIGAPIANKSAYVLTAGMQLAPFGVRGELYLGGLGVARGYVGKPALTAERFLPDPFAASGGRLYRTGDLARLRHEGSLEFAGRKDDQVKIRGFRVELGEVASVLRAHPSVRDAALRLMEHALGDQRLVAYAVADEAAAPVDELREFVRVRLPQFMVPASFVYVDSLPLTANGKVDFRRLPEPVFAGAGGRAAATESERLVADVWRQVLHLERPPGAADDFFALGGHSLVAARVIASLERRLGVDVPLRAVFERPTLEDFAVAVETLVEEAGRAGTLRSGVAGGGR